MRPAVALIALFLTLTSSAAAQTPAARKQFKPDVPVSDRVGTMMLRNSSVAARKLDLAPGASFSVPASTHDYLVISMGDSTISAVGSGSAFELSLAAGDMQVMTGGWPHKLINRSGNSAQIVTVEVARNIHPDRARCGLASKNCNEVRFGRTAQGEYSQTALFVTDTAELLRTSLGSASSMKLHDDVHQHLIVALTPFRGRTEQATISLQPGEVFWIDGGFGELLNEDTTEARLLILELRN